MISKKFNPQLTKSTKRLLLRPYKLSDYSVIKAGWGQRLPCQSKFDCSQTPKYLGNPKSFGRWLGLRIKLQKLDKVYIFGIFDKKTGAHYGAVDIAINIRLVIQCANLGYGIHNQHWGKGYAQEASKAVVSIAFKELKLHRVEAAADPANKASLAVARGIGMKKEGLRKNYIYQNGKWVDSVFFIALSETWGAGKSKPRFHTHITDYA